MSHGEGGFGLEETPPPAAERSTERARRRGSGGVFTMRDGVWRVDVEIARDPVTGRRRRVSRTIQGTREDAELALARLRVADHEKRLTTGGTNARSVAAVFQLYRQAIDAGLIELAPSTIAIVARHRRSWRRSSCPTVVSSARSG